MRFIYYGSEKFDSDRFVKPTNRSPLWVKPLDGGLWASPVESEDNWRNWCVDNDIFLDRLEKSFEFNIRPNSEILYLRNKEEISKAYRDGYLTHPRENLFYPNFELISVYFSAIFYEHNNETDEGKIYLEYKLDGCFQEASFLYKPLNFDSHEALAEFLASKLDEFVRTQTNTYRPLWVEAEFKGNTFILKNS